MVLVDLLEQPQVGFGSFSIPSEVLAARRASPQGGHALPGGEFLNPAYAERPIRGNIANVYPAQRNQTEAQKSAGIGLVVPGSANDY
jgi:hypothetical protein